MHRTAAATADRTLAPRRGAIAITLALLLGACGPLVANPTSTPLPTPLPGLGGMGLLHQVDGEAYPGARRELSGVLEVSANGCLNLALDGSSMLVIWPAGSRLDDQVRLPNGDVIVEGDAVHGTGALTPTAPLIADRNGFWAYAIDYCAGKAKRVVVFDTARRGP